MTGPRDETVPRTRWEKDSDTATRSGEAPPSSEPVTRRSLLRSAAAATLAAVPGAKSLLAASPPNRRARRGALPQDDEIVLGVSAAFSGPSRGLGTELYRGAMSYFSYVNDNGGINGRRIVLKLYDDGYQPDTCVANTIRLIQDDGVFLLFGYVGTPTVTRVLPLLKRFRDQQMYLFFPFTGAEPQRHRSCPSRSGK